MIFGKLPDPQYLISGHPCLQPFLTKTAGKRDIQELSCLQNIQNIVPGESKFSGFYPVQDQNKTNPRNSWKREICLEFVTFVCEDAVKDITVGGHDDLGHEVHIAILVHNGDVVELVRVRGGDETGQLAWQLGRHGEW